MVISSRTPEGNDNHCPVCGKDTRTEPSTLPTRDAPCPHCGSLLWFIKGPDSSRGDSRALVRRLAEQIARLSDSTLAPEEYYVQFLQRVLAALAAPAGAVWLHQPQGTWQPQAQINMGQVGLDHSDHGRQMHAALLRQVLVKGQPGMLGPKAELAASEGGGATVSNPTAYSLLMAPIHREEQVVGLVEVWQAPTREVAVLRGHLQFLERMVGFASRYAGRVQL